ncbi:MAG: hypothetical protein O2958_01180 [Gemmatimonadetes bacterium]|nr:hypothetical protein [Gemmatimonadota bacterium]MDA1104160.1 hypothetical protein [Gemmatimonadota bacterium]
MGPTLMIVGALGALGIGIWLGMPGRYTQTPDDIEKVMAAGGARRRKTKQVFTPLAWLQRKADARGTRDLRKSRGGSGFRIETPEDR